MHDYDYVMAGGGMAGLSLAHAIVTGPDPQARILIADPETKGDNDRTWCFWAREEGPFEEIVSSRWPRLRFAAHDWMRDFDLGDYEYRMIRGADFYRATLDALEAAPRVEFLREAVTTISDTCEGVEVGTDGGRFSARFAFDSRFDPAEYEQRSGPHHYLKQHFLGWTVETSDDRFDPQIATLFDFRTPQHGEMRFVYVLPFSPRRALVEYTLFSADLLSDEEYVTGLESYLRDVLGLRDYRVVERERGVIPMTDEPVRRRQGAHTLAIGTRGGTVKASTGYAFARTQRDTAAIVGSIERHGHPFSLPRLPRRFRALDTTLLQVMYRRGELSEAAFTAMFRNNPIERMLRFLDERSTVRQTLAIMASVPIGPFLRAFVRTQLLGKV